MTATGVDDSRLLEIGTNVADLIAFFLVTIYLYGTRWSHVDVWRAYLCHRTCCQYYGYIFASDATGHLSTDLHSKRRQQDSLALQDQFANRQYLEP
jgi:hypothetical protein